MYFQYYLYYAFSRFYRNISSLLLFIGQMIPFWKRKKRRNFKALGQLRVKSIGKIGRQAAKLNEYQTDPYFLHLSQNMAANCLFTYVFFSVLTCIYLFCAENCFVLMFRTIFGTKQVNSGKNREKHTSKQTIPCHVLA